MVSTNPPPPLIISQLLPPPPETGAVNLTPSPILLRGSQFLAAAQKYVQEIEQKRILLSGLHIYFSKYSSKRQTKKLRHCSIPAEPCTKAGCTLCLRLYP